jgi:fermentation-respiration switch protein FrsA (DUF1100 family)
MRRQKRILLVAAVTLCVAGIVEGRASLEAKLIFPGAATQGRPDTVIPPGNGYELVRLATPDGTAIVAQFGHALDSRGEPAANPERRPTVIFFYGNGSCAAYSAEEFARFRRIGANVLMPDFPGYGMSAGKPSEKGFYATADSAYDYLLRLRDIDGNRIVAAGWSMGAAVAIDLASRRKVEGLVTVSAFTTLPAVAHVMVPWLPTSLIVRSRFDNIQKIARVTCPIFMAHGTADHLVPPEMLNELAGAAGRNVVTYRVAGGGHNDVFDVGGDALWEAIRASIFQP